MDLTRAIYNKMINEHLMFVYRGKISDKNSLALLTLLENEMKDDSYGFAGRKRLFMYVLENLQNIVKHGDHHEHSGMSVVSYSKTGDGYTITTGNIIPHDHIDDLKKRLDEINMLNAEETRKLHMDLLSTGIMSHKGGAGLGLIEMAVKTGNKLDYDFVTIEDNVSFFVLSKTVDSSGMGLNPAERGQPYDSSSFMELGRLMAGNGIHMIWSGHISSDIGDEVLSITESTLSDGDIEAMMRRRVFSIMVELLENSAKYNPGREQGKKFGMPVAMVRIVDDKFEVSSGNLVHNEVISGLKQKLDEINSREPWELKEMFFTSLSGQTIESDSTGNLGLITVARKAGSKLNYRFDPVNEFYSYFFLTVPIEEIQG